MTAQVLTFNLHDAPYRLVLLPHGIVCEYQTFSHMGNLMWTRVEEDEVGWVVENLLTEMGRMNFLPFTQVSWLRPQTWKRIWVPVVRLWAQMVDSTELDLDMFKEGDVPSNGRIVLYVRRRRWWPWSKSLELYLEIEERDTHASPTWREIEFFESISGSAVGTSVGHLILLALLSKKKHTQGAPAEETPVEDPAQWN